MAHEVVYEFNRGDDFSISMTLTDPANAGAPVAITGWTIASTVKYGGKVVDNLSVSITNGAGGQFTITMPKESTALWPAGPPNNPRRLVCDIQFDRPGLGRISSNTFYIDVTEDVT